MTTWHPSATERRKLPMGLGTSIFLIAVGAIMRFAIHASTSGFSIHTAGTIIMIVGVVGVLISLLWMTVLADRRRAVPADDEYVAGRRSVREREVVCPRAQSTSEITTVAPPVAKLPMSATVSRPSGDDIAPCRVSWSLNHSSAMR